MGFFLEGEHEQLRIESMILHVVGEEAFDPQSARAVEHAPFFISRIVETDAAPVHAFKVLSRSRDQLQSMAAGVTSFELGGQELSQEFSRWHGTTMRDGAFFIFELRTNDPVVRIYSLIKYDYREVIEQTDGENGQQRLRRIVHAFIGDKRAVQKSALVRVSGGVADGMVAARDRTRTAPDVADYFCSFLDIVRTRGDDELNRETVEVLRTTFSACKELLPNNDVARALRHAKGILRERVEIDEGAIVEAVIAAAGHPENEESREELRKRTGQRLRAHRLAGLAFPPSRQVLAKPPLKKLRTTEGVTVTYPDAVDEVSVVRTPREGGPGETITITTARVVEDSVVPDRTR